MQIGLVGIQNSGKTTLFQTMIHGGNSGEAGKSEQNRAVIKIPDTRLDKLSAIFNPKKQVNAVLEVLDIPGLPLSDDGKLKITSDFLAKVKNTDALIHIVRQFADDSIPHPNVSIDPVRDIEFLETEFLLSDMSLIEKRLEKIEKDLLKQKNDQLTRELPVFKKMQAHTEQEKPLRTLVLDENERKVISGYQFLTLKPLIIGLNLDENSKDLVDKFISDVDNKFGKDAFVVFPFFARFEYELSQLSDEEAEMFKSDFGITESALDKILRTIYALLGLQSFLTVGEDECRAWTIKKNMTAQDAAGVIHTDFYNKFIRAEVVGYDDFMNYGSMAKCKDAGAWRLEGKEYICKDGDILNIRHS
ncbi:MAG: redox-regulated ATPase YchF [Ignavibacteria bacterium]|nr:redox-regulated ATPase YchF [Ignavibacteria bacterium]